MMQMMIGQMMGGGGMVSPQKKPNTAPNSKHALLERMHALFQCKHALG